ncbi:molybdopterin-dependent oxidoreductase [Georgenia sp. SUBG003]|uniref:molybdopterin-dependent oxidoreductase n=1 Tax=Georgenia sp. SUBG003 TaxID=1497974 RepID=UPI003AB78322
MPELDRMRSILSQDRLFLVVQDIFLSETAQLADVVLPAATWGEKAGTFTNADRTVHLSEKAVDPPGEARPDLDIFHRLRPTAWGAGRTKGRAPPAGESGSHPPGGGPRGVGKECSRGAAVRLRR